MKAPKTAGEIMEWASDGMATADEILEWARSVEPPWERTPNFPMETRTKQWEASVASDRATAERISKKLLAVRLIRGFVDRWLNGRHHDPYAGDLALAAIFTVLEETEK
jgi:hypothetical protein